MSDPYPIRPMSPDEFDAFHLVDEHAFHGRPLTPRRREEHLRQFEADRSLAAFDGDKPVGIAGIYSLQMTVPGAIEPAAGVTWVAVLPTHRRRGVASSLMHRQLQDIRDRGEAFAVLWASEGGIYGRFGYGIATWQTTIRMKRGEGILGRKALGLVAEQGLELRIADPESARSELGKIYDTVLPARPGMYARDELWWNHALGTGDDAQPDGDVLRCVITEDDSGPRGYALYTAHNRWNETTFLSDGSLEVRELVAADPAAAAKLWADLLSRDLTAEFTATRRPADDPLVHLLADSRVTRRTIGDALWARLTDLPKALGQRRYACPVDVNIRVTDELFPENRGTWRLRTLARDPWDGRDGVPGLVATCEPGKDGDADMTLDVSALGAAYLGGTRIGALDAAGLVTEHRPGAVLELSAAMSWDPAPWCPVIF
jgi:predicted acetyltransferase